MDSLNRKKKLADLIGSYISFKNDGKLDLTSEETIRNWLNDFLNIFNRDTKDTSQILQEKILSQEEKKKLEEIGSQNNRPDYTFKIAKQKLTFLDAKDISVNLYTDKSSAFQIKSYGWSIMAPCAFISNFEEFVIYDCTYMPDKDHPANFGRKYFKINEYLDNFEELENHLLKENIYNGKLKELYISNNTKLSNETPDIKFAGLLSNFRLDLANDILVNNQELIGDNTEVLSYIVQVIINRILFVRVCEARKIEEEGYLLEFKKKGFRDLFKKTSYFDFYEHYDGPLFERIKLLQDIKISNTIFDKLLPYLYYPSPYRFDVIPTKLLSDIYEIFLSKKITITDGICKDQFKSEYIKTKGAVSTPQYIVQDIIKRTIKEDDILNLKDRTILDIKVLDIACGSGVFLIELYDYLEDLLKKYGKRNISEYKKYFLDDTLEIINLKGKKAIIDNCIFGVDIDPEAVEVAKMALSLKMIDSIDNLDCYNEIGIFGEKILNGIGENIRCGNSLVENNIKDLFPNIEKNQEELIKTNPFDWKSKEGFIDVFQSKGGFDYIIGNPPYVEVKNYNTDLPYMHQYIKSIFLSSPNGKVDLAIPFIERGINLLNKNGRLGFIVQKRFFKTEYGKKIREIITRSNYVSSIIDFETTSIFKDRMTYVAVLILDKIAPNDFYYRKILDGKDVEVELRKISLPEKKIEEYIKLPSSSISGNPRSFDDHQLLRIKTDFIKLGTFGDFAKIKVGIQVLRDKAYHIKAKIVKDGFIIGDTHLEKGIKIEEEACRGLICNENYYPYHSDKTDTYVIFPYDINDGESKEILFNDFGKRYPLAYAYLLKNKTIIKNNVETHDDDQKWHLFTRVQNHGATYNKILIPMTSLDTFASVSFSDNIYCDNANMYFIELKSKGKEDLYSVSAIINSTIFSVFARSIANPQSNGYFKFNKQFLDPVPFPIDNYNNNPEIVKSLAKISMEIEETQNKFILSSPSQKRILGNILLDKWKELDNLAYKIYGVKEEDIDFFNSYGRNFDRINILN
ncbi:hypothetical protein P148_SR1C00001G0884 [candidate division SR1 bacterium RAAC1_SR1_1]|nr:hypothetical protein P148_SR1C00001G0884 [candidate division SR1 bacterium RAAC1_SR1_1]